MNYGLAKQLAEAGWPQTIEYYAEQTYIRDDEVVGDTYAGGDIPAGSYAYPTLSELIDALDPYYITLAKEAKNRTPEGYLKFSSWKASCSDADDFWTGEGQTAEEALANLWLNIQDPVKRAKTATSGIISEDIRMAMALENGFTTHYTNDFIMDCGPLCLRCNSAPCPCGVKRIIVPEDYLRYGIHPSDTKKCTESNHSIKVGDSCLCGQA